MIWIDSLKRPVLPVAPITQVNNPNPPVLQHPSVRVASATGSNRFQYPVNLDFCQQGRALGSIKEQINTTLVTKSLITALNREFTYHSNRSPQ